MKKSMQLLALTGVAAIGILSFNPDLKARVTGVLYGDSLIIGYPGTTVASIDENGALSAATLSGTTSLSSPLVNATSMLGLPNVSSTTLATLVPGAAGKLVWNTTRLTVCASTSAFAGSWMKPSTGTLTELPTISCIE